MASLHIPEYKASGVLVTFYLPQDVWEDLISLATQNGALNGSDDELAFLVACVKDGIASKAGALNHSIGVLGYRKVLMDSEFQRAAKRSGKRASR